MNVRLLLLTLACAPFAIAADEENPYKNAKVGDFATYKMTTKVAGINIEGTGTQTVIAKDDKEVTIEASGKVNNTDIKKETQKIDLSKPFDPVKAANLPPGAKVEKLKEGTEKIKVKGKDYDAKWETYKMTLPAMGMDLVAELKMWQVKDFQLPMVKMEMSAEVMGSRMDVLMELTDSGNAPVTPEKTKDPKDPVEKPKEKEKEKGK